MSENEQATAVQNGSESSTASPNTKFCKFCGERIDADCVICPKCGKQVETLKQEPVQPQVIINNSNNNVNTNTNTNQNAGSGAAYPYRKKIVALLLCIFLGVFGAHRFYVGKTGTGLIWLFTVGFFYIGWIIDIISIATGSFRDSARMPLV